MERVFNGALALLSILLAVFTFVYIQYLEKGGRPEAQKPYLWLVIVVGIFVIAAGSSALTAHLSLGKDNNEVQYYLFAVIIGFASFSPIALWIVQ